MAAHLRQTAVAIAIAACCSFGIPHPASVHAGPAEPLRAPTEARAGAPLRWAPSLEAGLEDAATRLVPLLAVVDDVEPARDANLFEDTAAKKAMGRFALARGPAESIERLLPLADAIEDARYVVVAPDGRLIARLAGPRADETLVADLHEIWERYRDRFVDRTSQQLKSRSTTTRKTALRDAAIFLGSAPDAKRLAAKVGHYLKRLKRDHDRRDAWNTLAAVDNEAALSFIAPSLSARSPGIRRDALDVFLNATPRKVFTELLTKRARAERDEEHLHCVVATLDRYQAIDGRARRALVRLTGHRLPSVRALATLAAADESTRASLYTRLIDRARKDAHENVRLAAILGVAKLADRRAIPPLERAKRRERNDTAAHEALELAISALRGVSPPEELDETIATLRKSIDRSGSEGTPDSPRTDRRYTGRDR